MKIIYSIFIINCIFHSFTSLSLVWWQVWIWTIDRLALNQRQCLSVCNPYHAEPCFKVAICIRMTFFEVTSVVRWRCIYLLTITHQRCVERIIRSNESLSPDVVGTLLRLLNYINIICVVINSTNNFCKTKRKKIWID